MFQRVPIVTALLAELLGIDEMNAVNDESSNKCLMWKENYCEYDAYTQAVTRKASKNETGE